ncbi:class I SAM-dependent methyltransferase [Kitasatospora griseola]|uniref:class I SAM-dependent methyltransferase n=1 Tax=Kitasatospora griseola TaxID=2064 RepID=UPI001F2077CB|nr:class I SAM-dependent methyltransferase [Kitasatospora griseola]
MDSHAHSAAGPSPSRTALMSAAARAAHLLVDQQPPIFADTVAAALLGERAEELLGYHHAFGSHPILAGARTTAVTRSRCAEERLAEAVARRGIDQYVVLGAGLDSFACRSELVDSIRVFEVDHPHTQEWKQARLAAAGITVPPTVSFVPLDLEQAGARALTAALAAAGFDPARPAVVSWLGVTMYLSVEAIGQVLSTIGEFAPGTELIAEHLLPAEHRDPAGQAYAEQVQAAAAEGGEPWRTFLAVEEMDTLLSAHGLRPLASLRQRDTVDAELWNERADALRPFELSVLAHAVVPER